MSARMPGPVRLRRLGAALAFAILLVSSPPAPAAPQPSAGWERDPALRAVATVDLDPILSTLDQLTLTEDEAGLLETLDLTARRADWPAPARDAALYRYALSLRRFPSRSVPAPVIRWLEGYRAQALVPHEDHPGGRVPLFNVRAATTGVTHAWLREEAVLEGLTLARVEPRGLVDAFVLETHPAVRAGYLEALAQSAPEHARAVNAVAARRLAATPALTPLAARAAWLTRDPDALQNVLRLGSGPAVHHVLSTVAREAPKTLQRALLDGALRSPDPQAARLTIAGLYPALAGEPAVEEALLARLGDERLGAAVALALAGSPSARTRSALEALAATPDRPASRRARLALTLRAEGLARETP